MGFGFNGGVKGRVTLGFGFNAEGAEVFWWGGG